MDNTQKSYEQGRENTTTLNILEIVIRTIKKEIYQCRYLSMDKVSVHIEGEYIFFEADRVILHKEKVAELQTAYVGNVKTSEVDAIELNTSTILGRMDIIMENAKKQNLSD